MILFTTLFALFLERMIKKPLVRFESYFNSLQLQLQKRLSKQISEVIVIVHLPLLLATFLAVSEGWLLGLMELIIWIALLVTVFEHTELRRSYKSYCMAACRDDQVAMKLYSIELGCKDKQILSFSDLDQEVAGQLAWINYRHFLAPIFILILFNPAILLLYFSALVVLRENQSIAWLEQVFTYFDGVMVRLVSILYLLSGNFSEGAKVWGENLFNPELSPQQLLRSVLKSSQDDSFSSSTHSAISESYTALILLKRTLLAVVIILALLTISAVLG
ncbi:regulatory signaling modulator protein AmpE [Paraferrimonas sp. SM1919]|uniref:regulatory signaling modulator protein AmpE n=1 Tax=Paraferrimonas sp. SM1919 TaxID=2662263 RepID=UPI0013D0E6FC|nr:regulatory signaling modulator protein AmpE [Paraferrimonas sp. SM1919]